MKKNKKSILIIMSFFLFLNVLIVATPNDVSAETSTEDIVEDENEEESEPEVEGDHDLSDDIEPEEVSEIHQKMDSILHLDQGIFVNDITRGILWAGVIGLSAINNSIESGVDGIISLGHFYEHSAVKDLVDQLKPFVMGLFLLALVFLGIRFMLNKIEKRDEVILNVLLAVTMVVLIPIMLPEINKVLQVGVTELNKTESEPESLSDTIIKTNVADIEEYVNRGFKFHTTGDYSGGTHVLPLPLEKTTKKDKKRKGTVNYSNANKIKSGSNITPIEKMDLQAKEGYKGTEYEENLKDEEKHLERDVLLHRTIYTGNDDNVRLMKLKKNVIPTTDIGQQSYYRYHMNWGTLLFTLLITTFALAVTIVKMGRIMFDIGFHSIFSMFVAVTDLTGGQRLKKMLTEILSSFAVLFVMVLIMKLFVFYTNWTTELNVNWFVTLLLLVSGAWALIDAPDIVQRILGIDAGLRSGYQSLLGAYAGTKMAGGVAKGVGKGIGNTAKGIGGGVAFGKGLANKPNTVPKTNTSGSSNQNKMSINGGNKNKKEEGQKEENKINTSIPPNNKNNNEGKSQVSQKDSKEKGVSIPTKENNSSSSMGTDQTSNISENIPSSDDNQTNSKISRQNEGNETSIPNQNEGNRTSNSNAGNGLISGTRTAKEQANFRNRAFNSGVNMRRKASRVSGVVKGASMGTARAVATPIRSAKNVGSMAKSKIQSVGNSVSQSVSNIPTNTASKIGSIKEQVRTPLGETRTSSIESSQYDTPLTNSEGGSSNISSPNIKDNSASNTNLGETNISQKSNRQNQSKINNDTKSSTPKRNSNNDTKSNMPKRRSDNKKKNKNNRRK